MTKYKHIFFDLDRTLWDFDSNSAQTLLEILDYFNLEDKVSNSHQWVEAYRKYNREVWKRYEAKQINKKELRLERFRLLFSEYNINDELLISKVSDYYIQYSPTKTGTMPFAKELLEYLYSKYKLYIITNGFFEIQKTKLQAAGIDKYFLKVFTSDIIGAAKPDRKIFEASVKSVNARKVQSLFVGDSLDNDIVGAKRFGIDQVWFNHDKIKSDVVPNYEIYSLEQLKSIL